GRLANTDRLGQPEGPRGDRGPDAPGSARNGRLPGDRLSGRRNHGGQGGRQLVSTTAQGGTPLARRQKVTAGGRTVKDPRRPGASERPMYPLALRVSHQACIGSGRTDQTEG